MQRRAVGVMPGVRSRRCLALQAAVPDLCLREVRCDARCAFLRAAQTDPCSQMLLRRGREARFPGRLHPHQFRHTFHDSRM
jgi:hypothetical protein